MTLTKCLKITALIAISGVFAESEASHAIRPTSKSSRISQRTTLKAGDDSAPREDTTTGANWKPWVIGGGVVAGACCLGGLIYWIWKSKSSAASTLPPSPEPLEQGRLEPPVLQGGFTAGNRTIIDQMEGAQLMRVRCDPDCGRAGYPDIPDGLQYDEDDEEEERAAATVAGESVEPSVSAEAGVPAVPAVPD